MASKSETTDVESQQKRVARRGRGLDTCLVLSVIVLFAALASLAVAGVLVVRDLQSKLQHQRSHPEFKASKVIGSAPDNTFKMLNFAYLEITSSELKNHTMPLHEVSYRTEKSVGSNYEFNSVQHSLKVKQRGSYFVYMELNVTCVSPPCKSGHFSVQLSDLNSDALHCDVDLQNTSNSLPQQKKCWTVTTLKENTTLLSQMTLPHGPLLGRKLELKGSGFGMFLVD